MSAKAKYSGSFSAFFISGTDTGVGKTFVTANLAKALTEKGHRVAVMKPVQTGLSELDSDDLAEVKKNAPKILDIPLELASPYRFDLPASPHLAAKKENVAIDIKKILACKNQILREYRPDFLFVEGAGGLMVPLNDKDMMIDLAKRLKMPLVLVARSRLGALNHIFLSVEALCKRKIKLTGIIMNFMPEDTSPVALDNVTTVSERLKNIPIRAFGQVKKREIFYKEDILKIFSFLSCPK